MDYLIQNATQIMQLCFGFGFLVLIVFFVRPLIILTRILQKADDLSDIFIEYIQRPIKILIHIHKTISEIFGFFRKK